MDTETMSSERHSRTVSFDLFEYWEVRPMATYANMALLMAHIRCISTHIRTIAQTCGCLTANVRFENHLDRQRPMALNGSVEITYAQDPAEHGEQHQTFLVMIQELLRQTAGKFRQLAAERRV